MIRKNNKTCKTDKEFIMTSDLYDYQVQWDHFIINSLYSEQIIVK